jgi:molybdopterin-containing oxidoreductase family membrane subunit
MLATGLIVAYGYLVEFFMAFYSGNPYDKFLVFNRLHGPYAFFYWMLLTCNIFIPQLLWIRSVRTNVAVLFVISLIVNMGMWLERFVIVVMSLHRDFLPSSWGMYYPTRWDWATYTGTIGLFLTLMFLFVRFLPVISIYEMRQLVEATSGKKQKH